MGPSFILQGTLCFCVWRLFALLSLTISHFDIMFRPFNHVTLLVIDKPIIRSMCLILGCTYQQLYFLFFNKLFYVCMLSENTCVRKSGGVVSAGIR